MKKLLAIIVLGLLVSGCGMDFSNSGRPTHSKYYKQSVKSKSNYKYHVLVVSPSTNKTLSAASNVSYASAFDTAIKGCKNFGLYDCVPHTRGWDIIYQAPSREDVNIAKAKNVCRKLGVTPGTDRFTDCTIKMMSTSSGQQSIIVGQQRQIQTVYPLHCRQMGGMSNC